MKMRCWDNPILKVDLTSGKVSKQFVDEDTRKKFLTGRGLADWLLYRHVDPGKTDPLSPDNVIVFSSGMLVGTPFPGAVRNSVVSLNVLTKGYGESSSAGYFAFRLKEAGYDGILICGRSPRLSYLWIADDHVEVRDASDLYGATTFETDLAIKEELKAENISTCTIGPAGEKMVRYALVNCDNRYLGRCGMGAVMGSKNLKVVAVKGTGSVEVARKERFAEIESGLQDLIRKDPNIQRRAERGSLAGGAVGYNQAGLLPVKNFQEVDFDGAALTGYEHVKKYCKDIIYCPTRCPILCDRLVEISDGDPYSGTKVSSMQATPAYNTTKLLIEDMPTTIKAFEMCNAYGIDIHSWTCVLGWAIECFERKILTREDTDSLELRWGDGPLALESIRRIAYREGKFGDLLAEGVAIASRKTGRGSEKYAMQIKGMELDDELRVDKGMTLAILVETRGAGHTLATPGGTGKMSTERLRELFGSENAAKPHSYDGKPERVALAERYKAILDCLGICFFSGAVQSCLQQYLFPGHEGGRDLTACAELISAATGWDVSEEELTRIAERILAVEKSLNILAGLERKDEIPPDRFFEPIPAGRSKGMALDREKTNQMLRKHSELHGWDPETGVPTKETLADLGLKEVAERLEAAGKC
ncbi:MAG: aldehyde ferredoxin oxidoreductase family protein [Planctomycetota bacterium]